MPPRPARPARQPASGPRRHAACAEPGVSAHPAFFQRCPTHPAPHGLAGCRPGRCAQPAGGPETAPCPGRRPHGAGRHASMLQSPRGAVAHSASSSPVSATSHCAACSARASSFGPAPGMRSALTDMLGHGRAMGAAVQQRLHQVLLHHARGNTQALCNLGLRLLVQVVAQKRPRAGARPAPPAQRQSAPAPAPPSGFLRAPDSRAGFAPPAPAHPDRPAPWPGAAPGPPAAAAPWSSGRPAVPPCPATHRARPGCAQTCHAPHRPHQTHCPPCAAASRATSHGGRHKGQPCVAAARIRWKTRVSSALRPGQGGSRSGELRMKRILSRQNACVSVCGVATTGAVAGMDRRATGAADTAKPVQRTAMCPAPPYRKPSACSEWRTAGRSRIRAYQPARCSGHQSGCSSCRPTPAKAPAPTA